MTDLDEGPDQAAGPDGGPPPGKMRVWLLVLGALGIIAVPSLIGYSMINRGDGDSGDSDGMGGTPTATVSGDATGVRDLMDIVEGGQITVDINGDGTATIRVDTTIDVACAVSYGPTANLGAIATDTDMNGGGHRNHHPLLVGLEPDTEYFYRISAIGPQGELYATGLRSFTNAATGMATPGPNLAPSATVIEVSSEFSANYAGAFAIDGDRSTEWSSRGDGDDAYIVLDMGSPVAIAGVGFRTREMSDGTSITTSFSVTVDGQEYGPFDAGIGLAIAEFEATGQVIRVDVETSTGGNTGAVEIEIYGAGSEPASAAPQETFPETSPTVGSRPGATSSEPLGTNIALGATVVDASSEYSDSYAAALAFDGDTATEWSSNGDGDDAYIVIDLGEKADIIGVGFMTRSMTDGTSMTTSFTATVGDRVYGPFDAGPGLAVAEFTATSDTIRIDVESSTGGNTGAVEIEIYGSFLIDEM